MYSKWNNLKAVAACTSFMLIANMSTLIGSASVLNSYNENGAASSSSASQATTYNINTNEGNIELDGGGNYIINGNGSPTSNTVIIKGNLESPYEYNITFNNVSIDTKAAHNAYGVWIQQGAEVNLNFIGPNTIRSWMDQDFLNQGILRINGDGSLVKLDGRICGPNDYETYKTSGDVIIESGNFEISLGIEGTNVTINGGNLKISSDLALSTLGKLEITGGNIWVDVFEEGDSAGNFILNHNNNVSITGGTINGVSYPLSGETAFDKELSNDKDTVSSEKTPSTGHSSEINLVLISTFLGLALVTGITLNRTRKFN